MRLRTTLRRTAAAALLTALSTAVTADSGHLFIQPEDAAWIDGPASLPPGAQFALLEGDPAKPEPITLRLKFPAGYVIAPHTHPAIEHVTVLEGTFHIGMGETFDRATATALPVGAFVAMPVGHPHFAFADEAVTVQLHSIGPWGITYIDPADDPRIN
jgi:hypothetical protein